MNRFAKILLRSLLAAFVLLNIVVMFHAYKFTHFYDAGSVIIKAQKDKSGWDKTKELLFGINSVKKTDTAPDTVYQTVYFKTQDSLKLEAWLINAPGAKGTVAMFHGHGGNKAGLLKEAAGFRSMGYNTLLLDFRAHGNSEGNSCTIGYKESEDVKLAYDYLKKSGEKNIILWGISMGAAAVTKAVNDYSITPSKIILEMPFGSLPGAVEGRVKMMGLPAQPLSVLLTFWGGVEHGFWAFNMKPSEYVKKIQCTVLLQWGKNDPRVSEKETMAVYNNISTQKKLVIYDSSGHESLCAKENAKWLLEVSAFLQH